MTLVAAPTITSANSLTVEMNKSPPTYNIGESISISGTATPNASVSIKIFDPSNITKVESESQAAPDGNYTMETIYTLELLDKPGTWKLNVYDSSTNETVETPFEVVSVWEKIEALESQLTSLQNQTQTLTTSVENFSSRLSTIESLLIVIYGAIATSVIAAVISIVALTRYLQKRSIYKKLVGKSKKK
jgi:hypothetical protein